MNPQWNGETRSNPDADPETLEIERLLRTVAYYERLGCANVASALRALAQAKAARPRQAGLGGGDGAIRE